MPKRYPKDQRDRAVRMVLGRLDEYPSLYAACESIAPKLGVGSQSLRRWTLQAQIDSGQRPGATSDEMVEIKALKNKVRDLEEANEILRQASIFFARELDPLHALICQFIDGMRAQGFAGRAGLRGPARAGLPGRPKNLPIMEKLSTVRTNHHRRARDQCHVGHGWYAGRPLWPAENDSSLATARSRCQCGNSAPTDG